MKITADLRMSGKQDENIEEKIKEYVDEVEQIGKLLSQNKDLLTLLKDYGLSTTEKKMLLNAKQILVSELVLAESKGKEEVEELVENKINMLYNTS